jgi:hypothetical protein
MAFDPPVRVRILGVQPPGTTCGPYSGVRVGLQVRKDVVGIADADRDAAWDTTITVGRDERGLRWRGPAVHGPRGERFFYLVWLGRLDGAPEAMFRRAKLQLDGIPEAVLAEALATGALTATVPLTDGRGMPRCASVRPPSIVWTAGSAVD